MKGLVSTIYVRPHICRVLGVGAGEVLYSFDRYGQLRKAAAGPHVPKGNPVGPNVQIQPRQGWRYLRPLSDDGLDQRLGAVLEVLGVYVQPRSRGLGLHRDISGRSPTGRPNLDPFYRTAFSSWSLPMCDGAQMTHDAAPTRPRRSIPG